MTSLEILVASFQFLGALKEIDSYSPGPGCSKPG